jgi:hypothetical protein
VLLAVTLGATAAAARRRRWAAAGSGGMLGDAVGDTLAYNVFLD